MMKLERFPTQRFQIPAAQGENSAICDRQFGCIFLGWFRKHNTLLCLIAQVKRHDITPIRALKGMT